MSEWAVGFHRLQNIAQINSLIVLLLMKLFKFSADGFLKWLL